MKIECVKEKLKTAALLAEKVTGKNISHPILQTVLLDARATRVVIHATNLDLGVELDVPGKVEKKGRVAVSGSLFAHLLGALGDFHTITLEDVGANLCLVTPKHSTILKAYPADEFPLIPRVSDGGAFSLDAAELAHGIRSVATAASLSDIKPEIASVYLYPDHDDLVFVATDSFRLAERRFPGLSKGVKAELGLLIPLRNALEVVRFFENSTGRVEVVSNRNQIAFTSPGTYLTSRLVGGVFPNYRQIMPVQHTTHVGVAKRDFVDALKLAHIFTDKQNQIVLKIVAADALCEISARKDQAGENTTRLDAVVDGEDVDAAFNARYLLDGVPAIPEENLTLDFNGAGRPMVIRGVGNPNFTYLVMPMNR